MTCTNRRQSGTVINNKHSSTHPEKTQYNVFVISGSKLNALLPWPVSLGGWPYLGRVEAVPYSLFDGFNSGP